MEKDIELLEKFIKIKINSYAMQFVDIPYPRLQEAIENLINRVKELEKENKRWEELAEESEYDYAVNLIPKSKIKEKIEDNEMLKKIVSTAKYTHIELLQYAINQLQDLLK